MCFGTVFIFIVLLVDEMTLVLSMHKCNELSERVLSQILGAAYNPRYMSVSEPELNVAFNFYKRDTEISFYVDEKYYNERKNFPAWDYNHIKGESYSNSDSLNTRQDHNNTNGSERFVRSHLNHKIEKIEHPDPELPPWHCNYSLKWIDLGTDYYPRYIRSVECVKKACWYDQYSCQPKTFTINVLKRKKGQCVTVNKDSKIFTEEIEDADLWVWEEKAVNFCCDCVSNSHRVQKRVQI